MDFAFLIKEEEYGRSTQFQVIDDKTLNDYELCCNFRLEIIRGSPLNYFLSTAS